MEESNWMGDFAAQAGAAHIVGSARGERSQLSAAAISQDMFLAKIGEAINALLVGQRAALIENANRAAENNPSLANEAVKLVRDARDPKDRWVDSTPEYSLHIPALRKLFPSARFVHIIRDPESVVKSLLLFDTGGGARLVATEREALEYWLRCVHACLAAERAWGPSVVLRVRYSDLVERPVETFERMFAFLGLEPCDACMEPLQVRMNSSHVPPDFDPRDAQTDPGLRERAARLYAEQDAQVAGAPNADEQARQWDLFARRVEYFYQLDSQFAAANARIVELQRLVEERGQWALGLDRELAAANARIVELQRLVEERSQWALGLNRELAAANARIVELQRQGAPLIEPPAPRAPSAHVLHAALAKLPPRKRYGNIVPHRPEPPMRRIRAARSRDSVLPVLTAIAADLRPPPISARRQARPPSPQIHAMREGGASRSHPCRSDHCKVER
jgi:hypothetical protein